MLMDFASSCPDWPVLSLALWWERFRVSGVKTCRWCPGFHDHLQPEGQILSKSEFHNDDSLEDMYRFRLLSILDLRDGAALGGVTLKMMDEVEKAGRRFMISQSGDRPVYCIPGFTDKGFHHPFLAALHFWLKSKIDKLYDFQEKGLAAKDSNDYTDLVAALAVVEGMASLTSS